MSQRSHTTRKKHPALKSKGHKGSPIAGNETRLHLYIKRTLELVAEGWPHHRIANQIHQEFNLERIPAITTVARWKASGFDALSSDIQELQTQLRIDQFNQLEDMKSKWLPLATAERLELMRWKMVEGELQPELDENAIAEQVKANEQVIKIMTRQAKLLGLDLQPPEHKDGTQMTFQEVQLWIINQQSQMQNPAAEVLTLETGLPDMEAETLE